MLIKRPEIYCKEFWKIKNYEKALNDESEKYVIHHIFGMLTTKRELKNMGLYYDRPPEELIWLTNDEHRKLHNTAERNPFFGKTHSDETRAKLSVAHKGKKLTTEHRRNLSESRKGRHWFTNGIENKFCYECPEGFRPGKTIN